MDSKQQLYHFVLHVEFLYAYAACLLHGIMLIKHLYAYNIIHCEYHIHACKKSINSIRWNINCSWIIKYVGI